MEPSLDLQKAIRTRLVASSAVTALVAASSILDRNSLPAPNPSIIIGEGQTVPGDDLTRKHHGVYLDLHIWKEESGLAGCKQIVGAVRDALTERFWNLDNHHVADLRIDGTRFLRDPGGQHSHAVMTLYAVLAEVA